LEIDVSDNYSYRQFCCQKDPCFLIDKSDQANHAVEKTLLEKRLNLEN
jgi:hypothetical protein